MSDDPAISVEKAAAEKSHGGLSTKAKAETADKIEAVITDEAMVFLSGKLSTPLQFETYLTRSFEEGYRVGQKPVTVEVIESTDSLWIELEAIKKNRLVFGKKLKVITEHNQVVLLNLGVG